MRQLIALFVAIVFIGSSAVSQNLPNESVKDSKMSRTEIEAYLASLPEVSVTFLTKSMLNRIPKNKPGSPLAMLVEKGGVSSVRVYQLNGLYAEEGGKKLIDSYLSEKTDGDNAELLMSQKDVSTEVVLYGFPMNKDILYYNTVLMYSKENGKKATLIIIKGKISDETVGELIDSFSTQNKAAM